MDRDGRGYPGRFVPKNRPRLCLNDLLKRRRMTLLQFTQEVGITTYDGLRSRCDRMGVVPPDQVDFDAIVPLSRYVNNPTEGVVVLPVATDAFLEEPSSSDPSSPTKRRRRREVSEDGSS